MHLDQRLKLYFVIYYMYCKSDRAVQIGQILLYIAIVIDVIRAF